EHLEVAAAHAGAHAHAVATSDAVLAKAAGLAQARRAAEDRRVAQRDEAMHALAHELRNPLNLIAMTLAFLLETGERSAHRRVADLQKLERAAQKMTDILEEVADAA